MGYPVTYHCPRCETIVEIEREGYLADKAVRPYPFEGWTYAAPDEPFEGDAADGVRFVCGESDGVVWDPHGNEDGGGTGDAGGDEVDAAGGDGVDDGSDDANGDGGDDPSSPPDRGCGEPFYLSFVRYEEGREVDPRAESEFVTIDPSARPSGPRGPGGPGGVR
ncbi:hypothetical protein [Halorubrum halodurans]|uniref:DUF7969 domain-containing protein n=1 Tax=Halorubrum halodurans TaxID=1383851 RepID=A0A256IFL2_9EURY|nr:hypothetical protein [Halorubrum halodurans]OYR55338.1 hypothetical protein DJ70_12100 [Halorubrum halodurans]